MNEKKCAGCGAPLEEPLARMGDLCERCLKDDLDSASAAEEQREIDRLDRVLRKRPK